MKSYLVCISGASGSGKTTIIQNLITLIKKSNIFIETAPLRYYSIVKMDDYYKPLDNVPLKERSTINFDHPNSMDFELLFENLDTLVNKKQKIVKPVYNFTIHNRSKKNVEEIPPAKIVFIEGIFGLYSEKIRKMTDLKIFVDTDSDICLSRRIVRDINERKRTLESVLHQYVTQTKPMFDQFIFPVKKYADLIVPEGGNNVIAIDILFNALKSKVKE